MIREPNKSLEQALQGFAFTLLTLLAVIQILRLIWG